jgi:hypothetical protein
VERQNLALFTPTGRARELAATALREVTQAIAGGDTAGAAAVLEQVRPESPDGSVATVAGCTGVALGLLDEWLSGRDRNVPPGLAAHVRLPAGHWVGERAATDVLALAAKGRAFRSLDTLTVRQGGRHLLYGSALALAAKGRAFRSLDTLTVRQGGRHLLYGSALALAAAALAWARRTDSDLSDLTATEIR